MAAPPTCKIQSSASSGHVGVLLDTSTSESEVATSTHTDTKDSSESDSESTWMGSQFNSAGASHFARFAKGTLDERIPIQQFLLERRFKERLH